MSIKAALFACERLLPGDRLDEFLEALGPNIKIEKLYDIVADEKVEYLKFPQLDVLIFADPQRLIQAIIYEVGFAGRVNQIKIGMTGDEVEKILGAPDRLWPMPHPNYVLLYDTPTFFRVELERSTEKVITMIR